MHTTPRPTAAQAVQVSMLADPWATSEELAGAYAFRRAEPAHTCAPDLRALRDRAFADFDAVTAFAAGLGWCGERRREAADWIAAALSWHDQEPAEVLEQAEVEAYAAFRKGAHAAGVAAAEGRLRSMLEWESGGALDDLEPALQDAAPAGDLDASELLAVTLSACRALGVWPGIRVIHMAATQAKHAAAAWRDPAPVLLGLDQEADLRAAATACLVH